MLLVLANVSTKLFYCIYLTSVRVLQMHCLKWLVNRGGVTVKPGPTVALLTSTPVVVGLVVVVVGVVSSTTAGQPG